MLVLLLLCRCSSYFVVWLRIFGVIVVLLLVGLEGMCEVVDEGVFYVLFYCV